MRRGNTCDVWERKTVVEEHVCEYSRRCLVTMLGVVVIVVQMNGMIHAAGMDRGEKRGAGLCIEESADRDGGDAVPDLGHSITNLLFFHVGFEDFTSVLL